MAQPAQTDLWHCLRYEDARQAIDWLVAAFGFEATMVVEGDDGKIAHAELTLGNAGVMVGEAAVESGEEDWNAAAGVSTARRAGCVTATAYVIVDDPDARFERAQAAGADIVAGLRDQDYGSRDFSARDPEGNVWTFGTYRPGAS